MFKSIKPQLARDDDTDELVYSAGRHHMKYEHGRIVIKFEIEDGSVISIYVQSAAFVGFGSYPSLTLEDKRRYAMRLSEGLQALGCRSMLVE